MTFAARFDDLTPGAEHSFGFSDPVAELSAHSIAEVGPLIAEVESAAARGLWSVGFITYEAAPAFDETLRVRDGVPGDPFHGLPLAWFGVCRTRVPLVPLEPSEPGGDARRYSVSEWTAGVTEREHRGAVATIRAAIARGETYQTNHTFRLRAEFEGESTDLYRDLILAHRGGYGAFLDAGQYHVLSASPELFFRKQEDRITVRPMKGTIRRGRWTEEDQRFAEQLIRSEKDRAENLMIVDLLRNDVGRIARYGEVKVPETFRLERYETLWQLTSQVEARLRPGIGLREILNALFPSGSVTGAPKASTMAIIRQLETTPRGVYCGAIGYVAPDHGESQFNVAIRTVVIDGDSGTAEYGTGGGITWDSTPESEYDEAILKARLLTQRAVPYDLLETLRWDDGEFLFLEQHLHRLSRSAAHLGFRCEQDEVRTVLADHAASLDDAAARVRIILKRSGEIEVETAETGLAPFVAGPDDPSYGAEVLLLTLAPEPVDSHNPRLYHKTTARRRYEAALAESPGADDVLFTNELGDVTESTVANLAVRFGSDWCTPPLGSGCLPGILRARLLAGGDIREVPIPAALLGDADDIALLNSVRGWRRAALVEAQKRTPVAG